MSTSSGKGEYLLLVRGADWHKGLSPEQLQNVMSQFRDWLDRLTEQGKIKGAQPLEREGRGVSGRHGRIVADGPTSDVLVESKLSELFGRPVTLFQRDGHYNLW